MAKNSQHSKIGKKYAAYSGKIVTAGTRLSSQDISNWVRAINAARNPKNPKRKMLYELYDNIIIDGHLESVIDKRIKPIINKKMVFTEKNKNGEENEMMRDMVLNTPWFRELLKEGMSHIGHGHALVELIPKNGLIDHIDLIPRANVVPETGFLMLDTGTPDKGDYFREETFQYYNYLIEFGGKKDYGKLMTAAQYVIYKRGGFGDWAQFAEIFGSPFRVGKYNKYDDSVRGDLETALSRMGSAPYAVIPEGASLDFIDNNQTGKSEVFSQLIEFCNAEISKLFVGQTMTTEDGSSRSQSEVHKEVEEEINLSDMIENEFTVNWQVIPKLREIGYPVPEGSVSFDQTKALPIEKRIEIDMKVSEKVPYPEEYWYKTYGIDKPTGNEATKPTVSKKEEKTTEKKKSEPNNIIFQAPLIENAFSPSDIDEDFIKDFYDKKLTISPNRFQQLLKKLTSGIRKEFPVTSGYMEPDYVAGTMLEVNLNRFGFSKSLAEVAALNTALDIDGSYSSFRKAAVAIMGRFDAYLNTEYNDAIATAQNASSFIRQMAQKDLFPYWRYETVGDEKVRVSHAALDGKIFNINDANSRKFIPPNEHNCRCFKTALRKDEVKKSEVISFDEAKKLMGKDDFDKMKKNGFLVNRGETLEVFDLNKAYADQLTDSTIKKPSDATFLIYGLETLENIRKARKLKKVNLNKTDTPSKLLTKFEKDKVIVGDRTVNILKDYTGREIAISERTFKRHLKGKYITEFKRDKIWNNVKNVLADPDEVYLTRYQNVLQYAYLKFYEDEVMVVRVHITKEKGMEIATWFINTEKEEKIRSGILIK